ncbi:MAG: hypothetical protein HY716_07990 [Planctomycetes bacterium]|nr:hypothetical protein [Planctomycetota bacterium]
MSSEAPAGSAASAKLLLAIGAAAQTAQILLLRELMALSYGTEAAAALLLGFWMGGGALGALVARRRKPVLYAALLAAAVLPSLATVRLGRWILGAGAGEALSLGALALVTLATSLPVAALCGALFVSAARRARDPGRAYAVEAAGAGAMAFLLAALLPVASPFSLAVAAAGLPFLLAVRGKIRCASIAAVCVTATLVPRIDSWTRESYWRSFSGGRFRVVETRDSSYGPLAAVEYEGQISIYHSGRLLFSLPGRDAVAPAVHMALLRHPSPRRVLLVGGGVAGALRAVLRHPVGRIDYVELDPEIVAMSRPYAADAELDDPRVSFHVADGRSFVRGSGSRAYDVILVFGGEPSTLAANRYYTAEFLAEARRALADPGILMLGPVASHSGYAGKRYLSRNGAILRTMRERFPDVQATAGIATWFLSGGDLRIESRAPERGVVDVDYFSLIEPFAQEKVNAELRTELPFDPLAEEEAAPDAAGAVNRDSRPGVVLRTAALQAEQVRDPSVGLLDAAEGLPPWVALIPLAVLGLFALWRPGAAAPGGVFAAGLFGSGSWLLILAAYQSAFGALYLGVAGIAGAFMCGMAAGAAVGARIPLPISLAAAAAISGFCARLFEIPLLPVHAAASALAGAAVGAVFPAALKRSGRGRVGGAYALDLAGGLIGALVFAPLALPAWGAGWTAAVLAAACLAVVPGAVRFSFSPQQ